MVCERWWLRAIKGRKIVIVDRVRDRVGEKIVTLDRARAS